MPTRGSAGLWMTAHHQTGFPYADPIVEEAERRWGRSLDDDGRRRVHEEITGRGLGYREVVDVIVDLFG